MADIVWDEGALARLFDDPAGPVGQDLERRSLAVEAQAKLNLSMPGSGRVYRRRGRLHQASAPGEPPAPDTGLLRASVHHRVSSDGTGLYVDIGSSQNVAVWTELGTRHMAPRPWLRPALDAGKL